MPPLNTAPSDPPASVLPGTYIYLSTSPPIPSTSPAKTATPNLISITSSTSPPPQTNAIDTIIKESWDFFLFKLCLFLIFFVICIAIISFLVRFAAFHFAHVDEPIGDVDFWGAKLPGKQSIDEMQTQSDSNLAATVQILEDDIKRLNKQQSEYITLLEKSEQSFLEYTEYVEQAIDSILVELDSIRNNQSN